MDFKLLHQQEKGDYESSIELNRNERSKAGAEDYEDTLCGSLTIEQADVEQYIDSSCLHIKIVDVHF
jgi:hypothetical protein